MSKKNDSIQVEKPVEIKKVEPIVAKTKFFTCPFCGEKYLKINNRNDPTSSWCEKCGKCFDVRWKEE
jgi:transcription elongation factor Elf1